MTEYYQDIRLVPDEDIPIYFIRNKVYTKFHKVLSSLKASDIGVSFPHYKALLGNIVRLHGSATNLSTLQGTNWLGGLVGYCEVSEIQRIPNQVKHRNISRIQPKMTTAKLRRLHHRGTINPEQADQYKAKMFSQSLDRPYLELESISNGNKHRRYIQFGDLVDKPISGQFDQFGLSKTATVPWF